MFKLKTLAAMVRCHTYICITLYLFNSIKRMQNENITVNVYLIYHILQIYLAEHCVGGQTL